MVSHQTFLGLTWVVNGVGNYFIFYIVLCYGMSLAPYIFFKVVHVFLFWGCLAVKIAIYLDQLTVLVPLATLLAVRLLQRSLSLVSIKTQDFSHLVFFPMRVTIFGSALLVLYGWDFELICPVVTFLIPQGGFVALNVFSTLSVLNNHFLLLRQLKSAFYVKIISMGFVFEDITRIVNRYSHFDNFLSSTWDSKISLSASTLRVLCFWRGK